MISWSVSELVVIQLGERQASWRQVPDLSPQGAANMTQPRVKQGPRVLRVHVCGCRSGKGADEVEASQLSGLAGADWLVAPEDIQLCHRPNGSLHLLGEGGFGTVSPPCACIFPFPLRASLVAGCMLLYTITPAAA